MVRRQRNTHKLWCIKVSVSIQQSQQKIHFLCCVVKEYSLAWIYLYSNRVARDRTSQNKNALLLIFHLKTKAYKIHLVSPSTFQSTWRVACSIPKLSQIISNGRVSEGEKLSQTLHPSSSLSLFLHAYAINLCSTHPNLIPLVKVRTNREDIEEKQIYVIRNYIKNNNLQDALQKLELAHSTEWLLQDPQKS